VRRASSLTVKIKSNMTMSVKIDSRFSSLETPVKDRQTG
jgi:hypothetical protein